jgi:hypothetical protein
MRVIATIVKRDTIRAFLPSPPSFSQRMLRLALLPRIGEASVTSKTIAL